MIRKYMGDAKDLAKRAVFSWLSDSSEDLLGKLRVIPFCRTTADDFIQSYAALLGVAPDDVFTQTWTRDRKPYLGAVREWADMGEPTERDTLFLDPDTGLALRNGQCGGGRNGLALITGGDALALLSPPRDRLLILYDEAFDNDEKTETTMSLALRLKMAKLSDLKKPPVRSFAYLGQALNLIFITAAEHQERLRKVQDHLSGLLGRASHRLVEEEQVLHAAKPRIVLSERTMA